MYFNILLIVLLVSLVILIVQVMQISTLFLMLKKDQELLKERIKQEKEYQFIKGLY